MLNINTDNITESYEEIRIRTKDDKSFAVTGLTSLLRIFLLSKISSYSKKKVLFITSTEQNALKYQSDLNTAFEINSSIMPFQNISMYETITPNLYDYSEQIRILHQRPNIVICPVKAFLEKFDELKAEEELNERQLNYYEGMKTRYEQELKGFHH